ncbi:non-ribosomal peptide synthetase [Streptomyces sp. NEAU-S77]|uniref:non-ribosomal peptide synthetase n=1 Tax=Streptomyces sp. NEAU-S77 TaxID=3411033 RepID=UPI003BA0AD57
MSDTGTEPIAANQLRLWIAQELDPESNAYNVTRCLRLRGRLDADALVRSVNALVGRHEILRTVFLDTPDEVLQRVLPDRPALTGVTAAFPREGDDHGEKDMAAAAMDEARAFTLRPFDLRREPPFRARLVRLSATDHMLSLAFHHIGVDAWSLGVFEQELAEAYRAFSGRGTWQPATEPTPFREFARRQRTILADDAAERHLAYWRTALPAELPPADYLATSPLGARGPGPAAVHETPLPPETVTALARLSTAFQVTPFVVLQTAVQILAQRFSGSTGVVLGGTTLGRKLPDFDTTLGFFVNTVPLHTPLDDNPSFAEALARGKETVMGALSHDDVPFDKIAEAVPARPAGERGGLYRIAVEVQAAPPGGPREWPGLTVTASGFDGDAAKRARCDLTFNLLYGEGGPRLVTEYDASLFDETYVASATEALFTLLQHGEREPGTPVDDLKLLSAPQWRRRLTARAYPPRNAVREPTSRIVRALADLHGERTAVRTPSERFTFRELVDRAEAVAAALIDDGAGPGTFVGVVADRSVHAVAALAGCWLARCAYVPIEPGEARERQRWIAEDAGLTRVLGPPGYALPGTQLIDVRALPPAPRHTADVRTTRHDDIAYAIYTSGTTGRPKATLATHANMLNVKAGLAECFEVKDWRQETVSLNGPLVFDVSLQQLLPMLDGATVAIVPGPVRLDPEALLSYVAEAGITLLDVSPAHLQLLVEAGLLERRDLPLRRLISGGEALPAPLWRPLARSGLRVFNCYGPTECTVNSTVQKVDSTVERPLIGTEVHGATLYIADDKRRVVPHGATGELYIAGEGVGPGYLNQPGLTAERFPTLPWGPQGRPVRVYRTGDRVRLAKGGAVEHLGRLDDQVKIRGNRVELREVTATLLSHPAVEAAETVVDEGHPGGPRLHAFMVAPRSPVGEDELRQHLTAQLPGYMVPARITRLDALPTTVAGKVDRRALRALCAQAPAEDVTDGAPPQAATDGGDGGRDGGGDGGGDGIERRLVELWREVLGVPSAGPDSHFFSLGGHSLLAARLIARVRHEFSVLLPHATLLERATPRRCTEYLRSSLDAAPGTAPEAGRAAEPVTAESGGHLLELRGSSDGIPVVCFHPLGGDALVYQDLVDALPDQQAVHAVFDGRTDPRTRTGWESPEAMMRAYATAVAGVAGDRGCHLVGWSLGGLIAHGVAAHLERRGIAVHSLSIWDAGCSPVRYARPAEPDWSAGPLTVLNTLAPPGSGGLTPDQAERLGARFRQPPGPDLGPRILRAAERLWQVRPAAEPQAVADRAVLASLHNWLFTGWSPEVIDAPVSVVWAADSLRRGLVARTDWGDWTRGPAQETEIQATHYSLIRKPIVGELAAHLMKTVHAVAPGR